MTDPTPQPTQPVYTLQAGAAFVAKAQELGFPSAQAYLDFLVAESDTKTTARLLGKKGGSAKSARKTAAARANGQKNAERVRALRATRPTPETPPDSTQEPAKS